MSDALLCVGGPLDGQLRPINPYWDLIRVPMAPDLPSLSRHDPSKPMGRLEFTYTIYRRERATSRDGHCIEIMAHHELAPFEAWAKVIAGYRP